MSHNLTTETIPKCNCLSEVRKNIISNYHGTYCRIDLSTITTRIDGKVVADEITGQAVEYDYAHVKKDGGVSLKKRKSFVAHDFCPWCGVKYTGR